MGWELLLFIAALLLVGCSREYECDVGYLILMKTSMKMRPMMLVQTDTGYSDGYTAGFTVAWTWGN